jgi:hypothetical protein
LLLLLLLLEVTAASPAPTPIAINGGTPRLMLLGCRLLLLVGLGLGLLSLPLVPGFLLLLVSCAGIGLDAALPQGGPCDLICRQWPEEVRQEGADLMPETGQQVGQVFKAGGQGHPVYPIELAQSS